MDAPMYVDTSSFHIRSSKLFQLQLDITATLQENEQHAQIVNHIENARRESEPVYY
jgi:hypothetical protein